MEEETLCVNTLKNFFVNFFDKYQKEVSNNYFHHRDKLVLFNSFPVKVEILCDKNLKYTAIVISKNDGKDNEFIVDTLFQEPMMVVAMANSKRFQYGENKTFLYLLHATAKTFKKWEIMPFVKDFINYELSKNNTAFH